MSVATVSKGAPIEKSRFQSNQVAQFRIGAFLWLLCFQFFVAEQVARYAWTTPYSWSYNLISDLGAVTCSNHPRGSDGYVCSPLHTIMNTSFIVQGVLICAGAFLLRQTFPRERRALIGITLLLIAGLSLTVVGFVPEDVGSPLHGIAAAVHLLCGNVTMILLGLSLLRENAPLAGRVSLVMGAVGLLAILLFAAHHYLGIGPGAMERIGGYPLPLWLTGMGIYLLTRQPAEKKAEEGSPLS